RW
ncbi:hypothetical protein EC5412_1665, partial [Escherichia coli 5412]